MDQCSMPPRVAGVHNIVRLLVTQHFKSTTPPPVGQNWVRKFINCHDTLKSKYNRKYDYQQAKCKDPELIRGWFEYIQSVITEYGILNNDIYNFDETGFQMGVIATAKVITSTDQASRPRTIQPGNCEWVTIIKTIGAHSYMTLLLVIFEAVMHQA